MTDRQSEKVTLSPLPAGGSSPAPQTLHSYLDVLDLPYKKTTYDLGSIFDCTAWRTFMELRGAVVPAFPADAHWPKDAETPIELVRHDLKFVWHEYPDHPFTAALRIATMHLNTRFRKVYKLSRIEIHREMQPQKLQLFTERFLLAEQPTTLSPSPSESETQMNALDGVRTDVNQTRARVRLLTCARS